MNKKNIILSLAIGVILCVAMYSFLANSRYFVNIPIQFSHANLPAITAYIEEQPILLNVDLGGSFQMSMNTEKLNHFEKVPAGEYRWLDLRGERYVDPCFQLKRVNIESLHFNNVNVVSKKPNSAFVIHKSTEKKQGSSCKPLGTIGRELLLKKNWLIDLCHSTLIATNDRKALIKHGYDIHTYTKVPLTIGQEGVSIHVFTDIGQLLFILDTGASLSIVRENIVSHIESIPSEYGIPKVYTKLFSIEGQPLKAKELYVLPFPDEEKIKNVHGLLGVDFFKENIVFLDFAEGYAYIKSHDQ